MCVLGPCLRQRVQSTRCQERTWPPQRVQTISKPAWVPDCLNIPTKNVFSFCVNGDPCPQQVDPSYPSAHRGDLSRMKVSKQLLKAWGNEAGCETLSTLGPMFPPVFKQKEVLG